MRSEHDASMLLADRVSKRKVLAQALSGRNRTHKDRKASLKRDRITLRTLWRMLDTGV
jgi:hypothetical protein